ncbi:MAG: DUF3786 domain-containing protein [Deltaproteobacteria bacterium]
MLPPDEYTMWLERAITGKNVEELDKAYQDLVQKVKRIDPLTIAEQTDSSYRSDGVPRIEVPFLHSWFELDLLPYRVRAGHEVIDTLPLKVLMLHHLVTAAENQGTAVRVMGKWIDCRSLQFGAFLGAHFAKSTTEAMDRFFSFPDEERMVRALKWGGKPLNLGDEGFLFHLFPRLPVALINWKADEEFPSYSKILYDVSASNYMPTHGLAALTDFLLHRLAE